MAKDKIDKLVDKYKKKSAPIKAREAANQAAAAAKRVAKPSTASRVMGAVKKVGSLKGTAILAGATYLGGKIVNAYKENNKSLAKLQADAKGTKKPSTSDLPDRGPGGVKIGKSSTGATAPSSGAKASSAPKTETSAPSKSVATKGGEYKVYKKDSKEAGDFRSNFAAARKAGKKEFTWQGRKYNTKTK